MFFEETPAVLSLEKLCEDHGYTYHCTAVKNHISSEMARELIAIYPTMYQSLSLVCRRVLPQLHLHILHHHLHDRIPYWMSTDTPKIQYPKEVEVRVKSIGETRCIDPQKSTTKIKMRSAKTYKAIYYMNCQNGCRNSERIWLMKVLKQSLGESQRKEVETLLSHVMNSNGAASKSGPGFG